MNKEKEIRDKLHCHFCNIRADISLIKKELGVENV